MRRAIGFLILLLGWASAWAQSIHLDLGQRQRYIFRWEKDKNARFLFAGKFHPDVYSRSTDSLGLVFQPGKSGVFSGEIGIRTPMSQSKMDTTWHDSPVLHVQGPGSRVEFQGTWLADNPYSKPILTLSKEARFVLGERARIKLVFPAYGNFTRQLWVRSDGTGILELAPGFQADRSERGRKCEGTGCIRLMNTHLISHDSAGLPAYYRPEPKRPDTALLNSHLVFERGAFSRWTVASRPQNFIGGLWLYDDLELITEKKLTLSGYFAHWSDYTNYGGLIFCAPGRTLRKKGKDTLELRCDTGLPPGSRLVVEEGVLVLSADPNGGPRDTIRGLSPRPFSSGPRLQIEVRNGAGLVIRSDQVHLESLRLEGPDCRLVVQKGHSLVCQSGAVLSGTWLLSSAIASWTMHSPVLVSDITDAGGQKVPFLKGEKQTWTWQRK